MRNVSDKSCSENQNAHFIFKNYVAKYGRARQSTGGNVIGRRKDAICVPCTEGKNTDTGSLYLIRIADSSKKYSVARHHVQRKPTVQFTWKHWTLDTVDSYIYANNKDEAHCCFSMKTVVTRTRHNVTLYVHCPVLFATLSDGHSRHSKCFQMCYATVRILWHWNWRYFLLYSLSAYLHLSAEAMRDEQRY